MKALPHLRISLLTDSGRLAYLRGYRPVGARVMQKLSMLPPADLQQCIQNTLPGRPSTSTWLDMEETNYHLGGFRRSENLERVSDSRGAVAGLLRMILGIFR